MHIFFIHFKNSFHKDFFAPHIALLSIIAVFQYMYVLFFHYLLLQLQLYNQINSAWH